jgi:signal transduction histidine kinase/CheY-like chemotaxis protein
MPRLSVMLPSAPLSPRPDAALARLALGTGAFAAAIGAMVLLGWYTNTPALLRIHPTFVAMQFNTALAFVLMAVGVIACGRGLLVPTLGSAALVAILSLTAGLQYLGLTGVSLDALMWHLGVDEALRPLTVVKTSSPGRMAPNTAVCFLLASATVASLAALPRSRRAAELSTLAGVAVAGISLLALLGYIGGAPSAYGWGGLTRMAVLTAIAMLAVGISVTALAVLRVRELGEIITNRLPALVAVGGTVVTLGLWLAAADNDYDQRERAIQTAAARIRDNIASQMRPRLLALSRMRERWEFNSVTSRRSWENEARLNLAHFPVYRAIAWVNPAGDPEWVVVEAHENAERVRSFLSELLGADHPHGQQRSDTLAFAERRDPATGEFSLLATLPLRRSGRSEGYIVGVISVPRVVELALSDSTVHGYAVRVRSAGTIRFAGGAPAARRTQWRAGARFEADSVQWVVEVAPSNAVLSDLRSRVPATVGLLGVLVTALLVWALRLVQVARQRELERLAAIDRARDADVARERAAELSHLNQQLVEQIAERERAQRDRESMQQQLSQAQKMEAVGQLAGGVAHDFNNLLTVITSYCELLLEDLTPDDARRADVEEVLRAAGSAARLTRQLLAFSRQQILQPQAINLNLAVAETEKMLRRLLPADITLSTTLQGDLGTVVADRGQLEQVLVNLVVNARDAMPNGGQLVIQTGNVDLDDVYVSRRPYASPEPGRYVMLMVSDTGHGMDEATQARIFEPFFTTKEKGRGTGLGLSTVYGIVKQSGGYVWLYSEVGRGTTFKIYLPRVEEGSGARLAAPQQRHVTGGHETVLLVEDDTAVRTIAHRILERHGYRVLEAQHGADALRVSEEWPHQIDLVVTDLVMPQMGGQEMARVLQELRPTMRVLMMSGYTSDQSFRQRVIEEGIPFLEKPFTPSLLLERVRAVLDTELTEVARPGVAET